MGRILRWGSLQLCQSLVNGLITLYMFSEASIGGIFYRKRFKSSTLCRAQCWYKNVVIYRWYTLEFSFSLGSLYLLKYCKMFMSVNFLVFSHLIVSLSKQLLIQHDAMNTKVGCHLGIIKQFLQRFFSFQ